jgi:hypothetical protein
MKLSNLLVPKDAQVSQPKKKVPTAFEVKRAACKTYEELVELGYEEGFEHPEGWADHVWHQRHHRS